MKKMTLGLLAATFISGCSTLTTPTPLPEGRWQESQPSIGTKPMSIAINDGRLSGYAGCNRLMAGVQVKGNQLITSPIASTYMMCHGDDAARESTLKTLLSEKPEISYNDGHLVLTTQQGKTVTFSSLPTLEGGTTRLIYVSATTKPCVGVAPMQCLQIREDQSAPWTLLYNNIEGFTPESGIAYRLRIKEFDRPNPPADASSKRWVLDTVLEQTVVEKTD